MTLIFTVVVPVLAVLSILAMVYFAYKALTERSRSSRKAYNVGRQESHKAARVNLIRSAAFLVLALLLLLIFMVGLTAPVALAPQATPTLPPTAVPPTLAATDTPGVEPTTEPTPTSPLPTPTATASPTPTNTPEPPTATVSSGVGVWLRSAPGTDTEQLEWLLDGTVLLVLSGRETAEGIEWQQVQTAAGVEGWVAAEYLVIE